MINDNSQMNTDSSRILLESELTYKIRGVFIEVSRKYGYLYKENIYHNACLELFQRDKIPFVSQPKIKIVSLDTGNRLGMYVPDFLINDKIIIELKALQFLPKIAVNQLDQYLKASQYEIGFLINFGTPKAQIIRRIYTNDRKPHLKHR